MTSISQNPASTQNFLPKTEDSFYCTCLFFVPLSALTRVMGDAQPFAEFFSIADCKLKAQKKHQKAGQAQGTGAQGLFSFLSPNHFLLRQEITQPPTLLDQPTDLFLLSRPKCLPTTFLYSRMRLFLHISRKFFKWRGGSSPNFLSVVLFKTTNVILTILSQVSGVSFKYGGIGGPW